MFVWSFFRKYIAMGLPDLTEVRAERDVLQARMSEQALRISSLSARLQQQRNDADALAHQATSQLSVQLHDSLAEVERLKEELDSKDKQLTRIKQNLEEREKLNNEHFSLYANSCNPKDKVVILERELSNAQSRIAQLESLARSLERDKELMHNTLRELQREGAEKEDQLQELLALKLDEDNQKDEKSDIIDGKTSARTLSDIVSISEFDEQDLQMRRAELKGQNVSLIPFNDTREKTLNRTLPPELEKAHMSSLNIEYIDNLEIGFSPRADSLPAHLTSTQNRDILKQYIRNVNETTMFGIEAKHVITDNCSMYPNRDANDTKENSVEPKKINFSLENTDNRTRDEFTSLRELGIELDVRQENFPDILSQLKHEIKKSRSELENCKSELKNAEEQLCEFPALKEEVEELKGLLENTMATMETDKKFYENQLDNFSSNKKLLEQRISELTQDVSDKSKDLHILKEDILRRENMILELAKEKRNLTNKLAELEVKIDELQSRNNQLEQYETESHQMRDKVNEVQRLEQMVSEKNQQIDSLNLHLDRLDNLQRNLNDRTEELDNIKEALDEKSNEVFHLQDTIGALNRDIAKANEENDNLNTINKDLQLKLTKLEKEQENASLKLKSNETELLRVNSLNSELTSKIDELKLLTETLKDKETEIEILHEDINAFHEEIASLKEQLKMVSRSPSPRAKPEEKKCVDRQASSDKKQLAKIRKQISLLQHELDFNKKELNDKAFELAKAKLDVTELRNNLSQTSKQASDKDAHNNILQQQAGELQAQLQELQKEKQELQEQLNTVVARIREESNVSELKQKLRDKSERCQELEAELDNLKDIVDKVACSPESRARSPASRARSPASRARSPASRARSPTLELERAVRDQLHYSHSLDEHIMEQILSSDDRDDIPRLALNTSKSSSSVQSSSRACRLRAHNEELAGQVRALHDRLRDKDALIVELNRVRDKLVQEVQSSKLQCEAQRDSARRLQLLLDTHKETSHSLQNQDTNMIQILKKRLESAMQSELELQRREHAALTQVAQLERALAGTQGEQLQREAAGVAAGEALLLRGRLQAAQVRAQELQAALQHARDHCARDQHAALHLSAALKTELADVKRQKHDTALQLVRAQELIHTQGATIAALETRLAARAPGADALTEIETTKTELARELATLKKCIVESSPRLQRNEPHTPTHARDDDRDHAIRYLHGRCLRLESYRKALVWQKRYLQRVVSGYVELEKRLVPPSGTDLSRGKRRFKVVATVVVTTLRLQFVLRRRLHTRGAAAAALRPATHTPAARAGGRARTLLRHELRLSCPASPAGDYLTRSPCNSNSPNEEPFVLNSGRGEAGASLAKLDAVTRSLHHALLARQVP